MTKKIHLSIRIISVLLKITFGLYSLASILFIVSTVLYIFGVPFDEFPLSMRLPINFDVVEKGTLNLANSALDIKIENATGSFHFTSLPLIFSIMFLVGYLILTFAILSIFWLLNKFIYNVELGKVFEPENIKYLKKISYILFAIWAFINSAGIISYYFLSDKIVFKAISYGLIIDVFGNGLWMALLIWLLSHIFEKGFEIAKENSLTI